MEIYENDLKPCPYCGGMVVMVAVPNGLPNLWCTECEHLWIPQVTPEKISKDWWNDAEEA